MSKEYIREDGSRIVVTESGDVIENGAFIGQINNFGDFVSSDGKKSYRVNQFGDIVSNNGGKDAGRICGNRIVNNNSYSSGNGKYSSGGGHMLSFETIASIVVTLLSVLVITVIVLFGGLFLIDDEVVLENILTVFSIALPIICIVLFIVIRKRFSKYK